RIQSPLRPLQQRPLILQAVENVTASVEILVELLVCVLEEGVFVEQVVLHGSMWSKGLRGRRGRSSIVGIGIVRSMGGLRATTEELETVAGLVGFTSFTLDSFELRSHLAHLFSKVFDPVSI